MNLCVDAMCPLLMSIVYSGQVRVGYAIWYGSIVSLNQSVST